MKTRSILGWGMTLAVIGCAAVVARADWWSNQDEVRGRGAPERETRTLGEITMVELSALGTLYIEQGDSPRLAVEAQPNLHEHIITRERGGHLLIESERGYALRPTRPIKYHLTVKSLAELVISSSGDIVVGDLGAERLAITIESSGDLELGSLKCPELDVTIRSSGDCTIDDWTGESLWAELSSSGDLHIDGGTVDEQRVRLSSSGDYTAHRLQSRTADIRCSSSGDARVRVSEHLDARTSSSGDILYYGDPEVNRRSTSSGDIDRGGP